MSPLPTPFQERSDVEWNDRGGEAWPELNVRLSLLEGEEPVGRAVFGEAYSLRISAHRGYASLAFIYSYFTSFSYSL